MTYTSKILTSRGKSLIRSMSWYFGGGTNCCYAILLLATKRVKLQLAYKCLLFFCGWTEHIFVSLIRSSYKPGH